jgi:hypothetical protein
LIGYKANKAGQHCWSIHIPSMIISFRCTNSLCLDYTGFNYEVFSGALYHPWVVWSIERVI